MVDTYKAISLAKEKGLDLVVVNRNVYRPIAKFLDWGKYQYQIQKSKKKSFRAEIKEIQLKIKIEEHDFQTKAKRAEKFLQKYGKIKVGVMLRGRENIYPQKGEELLKKFCESLGATFELYPKRQGSHFTSIIKK